MNFYGGANMNKTVGVLFMVFIMAALCSCAKVHIGAGDSGQYQSQSPITIMPENMAVWDILHHFNWMGHDGNRENEFAEKPFLLQNTDGMNGAAGVVDIDFDGDLEMIISVMHPPRGVPSVEVFSVRDSQLQSIGGFFESRNAPNTLSYYTDQQGQLLFLQETEAHYGGITTMLVATYLDDFRNIPILGSKNHYGQEGTDLYYIFPSNEMIECTNAFVSGQFDEQYAVAEEEYTIYLSQYMDSLMWVEDAAYDYSVHYHLYNYVDSVNAIRYEELSQACNLNDFQSKEEYKKTSDMVADALYHDYVSLQHPSAD